MTDEDIIRDLAAYALTLAHWYEGDCGPIDPLDKIRTYLEKFKIGQDIIAEDEMNILDSKILSQKGT